MRSRRRLGLVGGLGSAFLIVSVAIAGGLGDKFAEESARGDFAIANAAGSARNVDSLYVKVQSKPHQRVDGAYAVTCSKGTGAGSKSGNIRGQTTLKKKLKMPYDQADDCVASASAQLADGGKVVVKLFVKH